MKSIYVIGSLRNSVVPAASARLREAGFDVFDDWYAAGPEADDYWQKYETARGRTFPEALNSLAARHVFHFDRTHLDRCDAGLLILPAGKSGHLELGYIIGQKKPGYILLVDPDRWDVMYGFATMVSYDIEEIVAGMDRHLRPA